MRITTVNLNHKEAIMNVVTVVKLLFLFALSVAAQNRGTIINSGEYFYGSGISFDLREARDQALEELTEQIAVRVAKSFERKITESGNQLDDDVKSILQTHSSATLKNVKTIKEPQADGQIKVFCYLSKKEVVKVFNERKQLIFDMYQKAKASETAGNYAATLKLYYFSMLLMNSLPEQNIVYQGINFTTDIPEQINRIISGIRFQVVRDKQISNKEREITLKIDKGGAPLSMLDFTFWDGSNQVSVQGRDGLATFQLFGASAKFEDLKLNIKYAYYEARDEYNIIADLWPVVDKPTFNAAKSLSLKAKSPGSPVVIPNNQISKNWNMKLQYKDDIPVAEKITQSAVQFLDDISNGSKSHIRQKYAADPFLRDKVLNYVSFNKPKPLSSTIEANVNKTKSGYELRKIRMLHHYPSINKQSTEYLVLDFNDKGNLVDINTSITENLYNTFVKQSEFGNDWDRRQQIIKFVEKYRTAYLTRDIGTVDLMFAEDALILVGRKIERKKLPDNAVQYHKLGNEPDFEYIKLTKKNYINRQRNVFKAQKDIFLDFSGFDIVKKNNSKNVYGVEMRQSYASTTYSDEGYLFLLIDFSERDPLIYVRAWQPNEWNDSSLVRTSNFRVYK
jgi:hypothetical protein